jgi:hypothetical protein
MIKLIYKIIILFGLKSIKSIINNPYGLFKSCLILLTIVMPVLVGHLLNEEGPIRFDSESESEDEDKGKDKMKMDNENTSVLSDLNKDQESSENKEDIKETYNSSAYISKMLEMEKLLADKLAQLELDLDYSGSGFTDEEVAIMNQEAKAEVGTNISKLTAREALEQAKNLEDFSSALGDKETNSELNRSENKRSAVEENEINKVGPSNEGTNNEKKQKRSNEDN